MDGFLYFYPEEVEPWNPRRGTVGLGKEAR